MAIKNKLITGANFRDFDWNKAKLFYHIVKCGSFSKAARIAGIDQPSLTRQIQSLEKQMGFPLLIRKIGVGIVLTRKGEELMEKVAPFFLDIKGFCGNHYIEVGGEKKRKIRVVTTHAMAAYVIGDIILDYSRQNSDVCFELVAEDYAMDIILHDADIAIYPMGPDVMEKKIEGVTYEYLFSVEKKLYASTEYLNKYGEPQTVEDLVNHQIIAFAQPETHPYKNIHWTLTLGMPEGELHTPVYTSNSIETLIDAAEKGIGIIGSYEEFKIIKNSNLKNILPHVKEKPLEEYFVYPDYLKEDMVIMNIRDHLSKNLNAHRDK